MTAEIKEFVLRHLRDDDSLERAEAAWRGHTLEMMQRQYGASGQTQQEILDGYREKRKLFEEARAWVASIQP